MLRSLDPDTDFAKPKAAKDMSPGEKEYVEQATKDDEEALVNRMVRARQQDALRETVLGKRERG